MQRHVAISEVLHAIRRVLRTKLRRTGPCRTLSSLWVPTCGRWRVLTLIPTTLASAPSSAPQPLMWARLSSLLQRQMTLSTAFQLAAAPSTWLMSAHLLMGLQPPRETGVRQQLQVTCLHPRGPRRYALHFTPYSNLYKWLPLQFLLKHAEES